VPGPRQQRSRASSRSPSRTPADPVDRLRRHRYGGVVGELLEEPSLVVGTMFGFVTCDVHGRFVLALADKRPPWCGLLVPTERAHHGELRRELPELIVHPVLKKWLYLRDSAADFEASAAGVVALVRRADPRLGVERRARAERRGRRTDRR
jgi:hypothetical protein